MYPINCRNCYRKLDGSSIQTGYICSECWNQVEYIRLPYCLRCGHSHGDGFQEICEGCKSLKPAYFTKARGVAKYGGVLRKGIHWWKYDYKEEMQEPLNRILRKYLEVNRDFQEYDAVIPIPLHPIKLREREFNQAEILGKTVSRILNIPLVNDSLYRTRYTRPQMELDAKERFENVKNLFNITDSKFIQGKKVLLIDDVMTTGATVNECSKVLVNNGCEEVSVLVLARG